jgi:hypothetical protein
VGVNARTGAASAVVYIILAAILGRDVLARLATTIANDPGDPLLTGAILHWNAWTLPWSPTWWQFPIYSPTRDALAFSEHLLGLSVVATPIAWISGDPLVTYNLTLLLTFPLSALAMYALVMRLTGQPAAAFLAGLAYGFAPYRMSNLPHIQALASFWAPLALLGLHAYLETGKRRWLALYGAAWALQAAANGYALVFFSVFVGLWLLWFVVRPRRWRALASIAVATLIAFLPLAPIAYTYVSVHARHGFERGAGEILGYSADVAAVLCAPESLTVWGWLRVACRAEGELFPGVALLLLASAAAVLVIRRIPPPGAVVRGISRVLVALAALYALIVLMLVFVGPWELDLGFLHVTASDVDKPLLVALACGAAALLLALCRSAVLPPDGRSSVLAFYLAAAVIAWLLALGPTITLLGEPSGRPGPFALLQWLPGMSGLRVPARFWLITLICLSTAAGLFLADTLPRRRPAVRAALVVAAGVALLADGWMPPFPTPPAPAMVPDPAALRGGLVHHLPLDPFTDIASTWRAATGGWRSVNGYSGYGPNYYTALSQAAAAHDDALFLPFRRRGEDLHVVVADEAAGAAGLRELVSRSRRSRRSAENVTKPSPSMAIRRRYGSAGTRRSSRWSSISAVRGVLPASSTASGRTTGTPRVDSSWTHPRTASPGRRPGPAASSAS